MSILGVSLSSFISHLVVGLADGMIFVLLALGLSLIFGLLGIVNFAHGSLFVLGAYFGFYVFGLTHNFWLALLIGPVMVGCVGLIIEKVLIQPLYARKSADDSLLITFGCSLVIVDLVRMIWGKRGVEFDPPTGFEGALDLGVTLFPMYWLVIIAGTGVVLAGLAWFLVGTDLGIIIRAGTREPMMTRALGIKLGQVRFLVFGIGAALAGLAGVLSGPIRQVSPDMGVSTVIEAFVVVVVGGMGSIWGAVLAGLLLGQVVSFTQMVSPTMGGISIFMAMAVVLLIRPSGFLGEAGDMQ
jgi:branched-chain amino acid transport system permease protein